MTSGTAAFFNAVQIRMKLVRVSFGQPMTWAWISTRTQRHAPIVAAGMKPARNKATADWLVTALITIMKIAGGTSIPIAVPAAISDAPSSARYPAFFSDGISAEPRADTSAIFDPQMSLKKYDTTITDMPNPPRSQPTSARASSTPARSISDPANTNDGIASSTQLCEAETIVEPNCCNGSPAAISPTTADAPRQNTIGSDRISKTRKVSKTASRTTMLTPARRRRNVQAGSVAASSRWHTARS